MMGKSTPERCEHCDSTKFFDLLCHECDEIPVPRELLQGLVDYVVRNVAQWGPSVDSDMLISQTEKRLREMTYGSDR